MSYFLSTTACLPLIKRHCKNRRAQREPTTSRMHSPISILNDDVLLDIFYLFRLDVVPESEDSENSIVYNNWLGLCWWYKPAQVSRRWRRIILASPSLLDLHLLCTNLKMNMPVAKMLAHSPPLPLAIVYTNRFGITMNYNAAQDEEHALLAISHRDRVHRIVLWMSPTSLQRLIPAMSGEFPILEYISINCFQKDELISFTFPRTFRAPSLRRIYLQGVALPLAIRSPILTSSGGLLSLWLINIPSSAYSSPNQMLTQLSLMPQLERLAIEFPFALPNRDVVDTTIMTATQVRLANLRAFSFKGVSTYLEDILSRLTTPVLLMFQVEIFNQLTFTVPRLLRFIQLSENLIPADLWLFFDGDRFKVSSETEWYQELQTRRLDLRIDCQHLDWQVALAVQLLHPLSPILSVVKKLTITLWGHNRASEWHDDVDRTQWRKLLEPFNNVKALHVEGEYVKGLSYSLRSEDGEPFMELLPNLEELTHSSGTPDVHDALALFVNERQAAGHPVHLHRPAPW